MTACTPETLLTALSIAFLVVFCFLVWAIVKQRREDRHGG